MSFPPTRHSILARVASADDDERRQAFDALAVAYWKPIYKYLRVRWNASPADAEDLTQGFFARAFEKSFFDGYDATRARFRTFLRTCIDGYAANELKAASRVKRGGRHAHMPLEFAGAEAELGRGTGAPTDPEEYFHREWLRALFGAALDDLRARCRETNHATHLALFERYDLADGAPDRLSYADLGRELGLSTTDVTNQLAWARREFRRLILERLRAACPSEDDFENEARHALGASWR